ncbi:GNAT family acetyltransferase [Caldovatus sediminis]|uniref:GNAT family acetyltransferase n=1 Tax=Caldovatus sediminis TaxID=2041189 RepID=A0A8J2ZCB4_9PROT|nr:GNAT family N-acetyltransferase [Caldovatus sediminis]GGG38799.1 GNAT family acetyltransferase [Caldovatus sediminis]
MAAPPAPLRFELLRGAALAPWLDQVARLRIAVFREWPYLYEGDEAYERRYLATYAESPGAALVVAIAPGERVVGAATCQPMTEAAAPVREAIAGRGLDPRRFCYFGESVLLPEWRGRGAGVRFFQEREAHARGTLGLDYAAFCAVRRDPDDPRRPADYVPLDGFWRRRGYTPYPDLRCVFSWREIGQAEETPHELSFWIKPLAEGVPLP